MWVKEETNIEVLGLLKQIREYEDNRLWWNDAKLITLEDIMNNNTLNLSLIEQSKVLLSDNPLETLKTILNEKTI